MLAHTENSISVDEHLNWNKLLSTKQFAVVKLWVESSHFLPRGGNLQCFTLLLLGHMSHHHDSIKSS